MKEITSSKEDKKTEPRESQRRNETHSTKQMDQPGERI